MNKGLVFLWIIETVILGAVEFAIQIPLRRQNTKLTRILKGVLFPVKLILIIVMALLFIAINSSISYRHGEFLVALYIVFIGDAASSVVEYMICYLRGRNSSKAENSPYRLGRHAIIYACFCVCFFLYGFINSQIIRETKHVWTAEGITRSHTFAFVADLHVGSAQPLESVRKLCQDINEAKPEFVILGGDITDELTSYENMTAAYEILSTINSPVYFVYGNHDRQVSSDLYHGRTYQDEQLVKAIQEAGIQILSDEYVRISDDLVLLGREDISAGQKRKEWSSLVNPYEGTGALIVADHQPYDTVQLEMEKSVLQLSGHTHAGQLWPMQFFYRFFLKLPAFGEFIKPQTRLYVSAGANDWMLPFRTEEHCEWELITLEIE